MSKLVCKNCKSISVEYEDYCGGTSYYRCKTCGQWGDKDKFTQPTVFDRLTASPEVLAEKLVYYLPGVGWYFSTLFDGDTCWKNKAEAIAATVAKLSEVEK